MKAMSPSHAYKLLEPGPIVLVTTRDAGKPNVMTMGFQMRVQHDPPVIGCVIGPWDHSFLTLRATGECVLAVPGVELAKTVVDIGNCSGADVDKFDRFDLRTGAADAVAAPLLPDCLANIECKVVDDRLVDDFNLFLLSAERLWVDDDRTDRRMLHHRGDGSFFADGELIDFRDRMVKWRDLPA